MTTNFSSDFILVVMVLPLQVPPTFGTDRRHHRTAILISADEMERFPGQILHIETCYTPESPTRRRLQEGRFPEERGCFFLPLKTVGIYGVLYRPPQLYQGLPMQGEEKQRDEMGGWHVIKDVPSIFR